MLRATKPVTQQLQALSRACVRVMVTTPFSGFSLDLLENAPKSKNALPKTVMIDGFSLLTVG